MELVSVLTVELLMTLNNPKAKATFNKAEFVQDSQAPTEKCG